MYFDNIGSKNGTYVFLSQKLNKALLWFGCKHHISKLMLEGIISPSLQSFTSKC